MAKQRVLKHLVFEGKSQVIPRQVSNQERDLYKYLGRWDK
jgi:hypothetical protein